MKHLKQFQEEHKGEGKTGKIASKIIHSISELWNTMGYEDGAVLTHDQIKMPFFSEKIRDNTDIMELLCTAWKKTFFHFLSFLDPIPNEEWWNSPPSELYEKKGKELIKNGKILPSSTLEEILKLILDNPVSFTGMKGFEPVKGSGGLICKVSAYNIFQSSTKKSIFEKNLFILKYYIIDSLLGDGKNTYQYSNVIVDYDKNSNFIVTGDGWKLLHYKERDFGTITRSTIEEQLENGIAKSILDGFSMRLFTRGTIEPKATIEESELQKIIKSIIPTMMDHNWGAREAEGLIIEAIRKRINNGIPMDYLGIISHGSYIGKQLGKEDQERITKLSKAYKLLQRKGSE